MDTKNVKFLIEREAKKMSDSQDVQKEIADFALKQVQASYKLMLDNVQNLISPETQVMILIDQFVRQEMEIDTFIVPHKKEPYMTARHLFVYLCDCFINTDTPKTKFARAFKRKTKKKKKNRAKISEYLMQTSHALVHHSLKTTKGRMEFEKTFKKECEDYVAKLEIVLNCCYSK